MAGPPWREILIVTGGMTPQVVTETVHALAGRAIVPAKIICVVTSSVAPRFARPLEQALERLRRQLGVDADWKRRDAAWPETPTGLFVEFPHHADDSPVSDIRSDVDATRFADFISEVVRVESSDEDARIHLSLAGGRKTMSFHGGAALSLFGRLHDELSHVLVHPQDFEACPDFWFPTTKNDWIDGSGRDNPSGKPAAKRLNARDARIELGLIPFLRMRDNLPAWARSQRLDYASYVKQAQAVNRRLQLELVTSQRLVRIVGVDEFMLGNREFALYQLMAEWCQLRRSGAGLNGIGPHHEGWLTPDMLHEPHRYHPNAVERFTEIYKETFVGPTEPAPPVYVNPGDDPERVEDNKGYFSPIKSRLIDALQKRLHIPELADRFGAPLKPRRPARFGLGLTPDEISITAG